MASSDALPAGTFHDSMEISLSLEIAGRSFAFTAGSILKIDVASTSWGAEGAVQFYVSAAQDEDPLVAAFTSTEPIRVEVSFTRDTQGEDDLAPAKVVGYAVARSVLETVGGGITNAPVVRRQYRLRFVDPARAFWTLHHPVELYVNACMQDVLDAQTTLGVVIDAELSKLDEKQPILFLPLDADGGPSFYDFLIDWIDASGGVFEFDSAACSYRIGGKKAQTTTETALVAETVEELEASYPEPPRFTRRVLNGVAVSPTRTDVENALAASGVRCDVLLRTPIAEDAAARAVMEATRVRARPTELEITFRRCPDVISMPGAAITLGEGFSAQLAVAGAKYRVFRVSFSAEQKAPEGNEPQNATVVYTTRLSYAAEDATSAIARLPDSQRTSRSHGLDVEGVVVSVGGSETDRTWAATENPDTSLWMYKVSLPLFNHDVPAPFAPTFASGHFFFPAYKGQRVLVRLSWNRAVIAGFLDWADEARLPSDSQGNQIVMGPSLGNGTRIRHAYVDAKPVLTVERKTAAETQVITVADGVLRLSLTESETAATTIETFDVTPQVAAAQDEIAGAVEGSISTATSQFSGSAGQLSAATDSANAKVTEAAKTTQNTVGTQLSAKEAELQGSVDGVDATIATIAGMGEQAKATIAAANGGLEAPRARLTTLTQRIDALTAQTKARAATLEGASRTLGGGLDAPVDAAVAAAAAATAAAEARIAALSAAAARLTSSASSAPLVQARADAAAFGTDVAAALAATSAGQTAEMATLAGIFGPASALVTTRRAALAAALARADAATAPAERRRTSLAEAAAPVDASLARTTAAVASAQAAAQQQLATVAAAARRQLSALAAEASAIGAASDAAASELASAADAAVARTTSQIHALASTVLPPLSGAPAAGATAKATLASELETTQASLRQGIASATAAVLALGQDLTPTIAAALGALDTAQATIDGLVTTGNATVDGMVMTVVQSLQRTSATIHALIDGGTTALGSVRELLRGLSAQVMPPIQALSGLVTQLQDDLRTGTTLLEGFTAKAEAVLGAIKASGLPQALVAPAVAAIQEALSVTLPLIEKAAQQVGTQLQNSARTLLAQVDAAEATALAVVSRFEQSVTTQIDAIAEPILEQITAAQAQIASAAAAFQTDVTAVATTAASAMASTSAAAGQRADATSSGAGPRIDDAKTASDAALGAVAARIAETSTALAARSTALAAGAVAPVAPSNMALQQGATAVDAAIAASGRDLSAGAARAARALCARIAAARRTLSAAGPTLDAGIATVKAQASVAAAQLQAQVPTQAALDAAVGGVPRPPADR